MVNNDARIEALKKVIEEKKNIIAEKDHPVKFITKKILSFDGVVYNFNVLSKADIAVLIGKLMGIGRGLDSYDEDLFEYAIIDGHHISEWVSDLNTQIQNIFVKEEKKTLKALEAKLDTFFSEDKKVQMELDEIELLLKG